MNAFTYLKNVGKSLGYAAVDTFKDINPTTASFIASGKEAGEELFSTVKDFTASVKSANDDPDSLLGLAKSTAKETLTNALSDLKTGKWYNKQRYDDNMSEAVGDMLGMDFESDFDFDFDEDENYDDDDSDTEEDVATRNSKAEISAGRQNTIANIKSMDRVAQKMAGSIGTSNIKAAQYVGEVNKNGFKEMLRLNNKGFAGVMNGMTAINANMASLMQLGEPITQHINNSATFYAKTNQWQDAMLAKMDQLVNQIVPQQSTPEARNRHRFGDLFTSEGALDLVAIKDTITSSVKDAISPVTDIFGLMDPKQIAADIKSNPLGKLMSLGMKALLPKDFKTGMKGLDSLLGSFFSGFMTKLRAGKIHSNKDGLAGSIIDFLLTSITPESGYKDKLDTSNYNKGKTDWNGKSEKALTEVIPTYLAEIAAAVTNKPMKLYDYNAGRFKTVAHLSKEFNDTKHAYANLGKGDFVSGMQQTAYRYQAANKDKLSNKELRQLQDDLDNFNYQAFTSDNFDFQDLLDAAIRDSRLAKKDRPQTDYKKYGIKSQKTYDFMVEYIKQLQKSGKNAQLNNYGGDLERGRAAYGDLMDMEEQGDSPFRALFNGTFLDKKGRNKDVATIGENKKSTNFLTSATDQYDKNIFFYLQDIRDAAVLFKYNIEKFISPTAVDVASNGAISAIIKNPKPLTKSTKNGKYKIPTTDKKIKFDNGKPESPNNNNSDEDNSEDEDQNQEETLKKKRGRKKGDFDGLGGFMNEDLDAPLSQSDFGDDTDAYKYYVNKLNGTLDKPNAKYDKLIEKLEKKNNIKVQAKNKFQKFTQKYKDKRAKWDKGGKFTRAINSIATKGQNALTDWLYRSVPGAELIQTYFPELGNGIGSAFSSFKDWLIYGDGEEDSGSGSGLLGIAGGRSKRRRKNKKRKNKLKQAQEEVQQLKEEAEVEEQKTKGRLAQTASDFWKAFNDNIVSQFTDDYKSGKDPKKDDSKKKAIGNIIDGAIKDAGGAKDSMITGALIGGGAGLFTGSIIGPIAGAAIGAGVGLISKSKTIQDALFGKEVSDGAGGTERAGGLLGKKISNFIVKNTKGFSNGARGAIIGGLGGTLLGSPILGAIAGSAIGFIKNSDQAQQKLFGTMGDDGERKNDGLIKKDLQEKFKSRKLGMIAGGIGGAALSALIGGPLGLAGNIIIGSAVGFAADNENFKKRIFGEKQEDGKRKGGLIGYIKTDVFQPIVGIFDKLARNIKDDIQGFFKKSQKRIRNFLIKRIGNKIKKSKLGRRLLGIGDKVAGAVKKLNPLTRINNRLTKKSLNRGVGFIDPTTGKWVDATGRQKMREDMGLSTDTIGAQMDQTIAQFGSEKDYTDMQEILKAAQDPRKIFEERMLKGKKNIRNALQADTSLDEKKKSKLMKAIAKGDFEKVGDLTKELGITPDSEQFKDLAEQINLYKDNSNKADDAENNATVALNSLFESRKVSDKVKAFFNKGNVKLKEADIQRLLDIVAGDKKSFLKNQEEAEAKAEAENEKKANKAAADDIPKITEYLQQIKETLDKHLGNDSVFADHLDENGNPVDKKGNPIKKPNALNGEPLKPNPFAEKIKKANKAAAEEPVEGEPAVAGAGWLKLFKGGASKPKKGDTKSENGVDYIFNGMTWEKDQESTDTNEAEKREKARSGFMTKVGGFGKGIKNIAKKIGDLTEGILGGGKKKKKGLFSKLGDMLLGENGLFGGLLSFFTGGKGGGGLVGKLLSKFDLGGAIAGGLGLGAMAAGIYALFSGKLDDIASKIDPNQGKGESQKGTNSHASYTGNQATDDSGKTHTVAHNADGSLVTDKNGDYVDTDGKSIKGSGKRGVKYTNATATDSLSTRAKKQLKRDILTGDANGTIRGTVKLAGKFAERLPKGKTITKITKGVAGKAAAKAAQAAGNAAAKSGFVEILASQISRVAGALGKLPAFKGAADALADFGNSLSKNAIDAMETGSKAAAGQLGKGILSAAAFAVKIVTIGWDFSEGFQDASTTLKIKNPSFGQKVMCGALRAIKNLIPVIGMLIPDATITDLFIDKVGPAIGLDMEGLKNQRADAKKDLDEYNQEHGTNYNWQEYNKQVRGKYTFGEKVSNKVKGAVSSVKAGVKNFGKNVKKKGFVKAVADTAPAKAIIKVGKKVGTEVGENFKNGQIAIQNAMKGDLKALWIQDIDTGKDKDDASMNLFQKAGMISNRIMLTPMAIMAKVGKAIGGVFKKIGGFAKKKFGKDVEVTKNLLTDVKNGNISNLWFGDHYSDQAEEDYGALNIFDYCQNISRKLILTPATLISKAGHAIFGVFSKLFGKVKDELSTVGKIGSTLAPYVKSGDVTGLWKNADASKDDSPLSPFNKVVQTTAKVIATPSTALSLVGHKIAGAFGKIFGKVKGIADNYTDNAKSIKEYVKSGDISGLLGYEPKAEDKDNPMGGFTKTLITIDKYASVPMTAISWVGHKIASGVASLFEGISSDSKALDKAQASMKTEAADGSVGGVWDISTKFSSPVKGIFTVGANISKLFYTAIAIFNKLVKPIKDVVKGVGEGFDSVVDKAKDIAKDAGEKISDTASGVFDWFKSGIETIGNGISGAVDSVGGNSGLPRMDRTGGASFISQISGANANKSLGDTSVGAMGCGPASAAMALGESSMDNAISSARNYQSAGGTDASFFEDYLSSKGKSANYMRDTGDIASSVASGKPTILLGRDSSNTSKSNSPFGPNNHYVVANGVDSKGDVLINDPEQSHGNVKYSPDILKNVSLGVGVGGGSGLHKGRTYYGMAGAGGATAEQIMDQDLCVYNPITAEDINKFIKHKNPRSTWVGHGDLFIAASKASGYDPRYILAHLVNEAGWIVKSTLAKSHNYFGIGAYDSNPMNGLKFSNKSMRDGVVNGAVWIHNTYYKKRKRHTLRQMWTSPQAYSTTASEPMNIAKIMAQMSPGALKKIDTSGVDGSSSSSSSGSSSQNLGILGTITSAFTNGFAPIFGGTTDSGSSGDSMDGSGIDGTTPEGQGTAKSAVEIAKSQIGYQEKASNSHLNDFHANPGDANYTKYGKFTGANGAAWCASFVSWVMNQTVNGDKKKLRKLLRGGKSASVSGLWSNFKNAKAMTKTPQPGDVIIYKNGSSHTGIVASVNTKNKTFNSIEGNTSGGNGYNRDGGQVAMKKNRSWNYSKLTGFGRPNWNAVSGGGSGLSDSAIALLEDFTGGGSNTAALKAAATTGNNASHAAKASISASPRMSSNLKALTVKTGNTKTEIAASMSKSTALLLKTIITLIEQLVDNTSKVESIYDVLSNYIASGGSNMSEDQQTAILKAATTYTDRTVGSNSNSNVQNTLSSLRTQVDAVLAS